MLVLERHFFVNIRALNGGVRYRDVDHNSALVVCEVDPLRELPVEDATQHCWLATYCVIELRNNALALLHVFLLEVNIDYPTLQRLAELI